MSFKHKIHKLTVIALLLAIFSVPFYLERSQIRSMNDSVYMAGAVVKDSNETQSDDITNSQVNTWSSAVGSNFIGQQAK